MKKSKIVIPVHIILGVSAVFGWWGFLSPELTMTPSTYNIVYEDGTVQEQKEVIEWDVDDDIYWEILEADSSQIHFKSRLLTDISAFQKQGRDIHESGRK